MAKYRREKESLNGWTDWIQPIHEGYKMACCDCGLVHTIDFRIKDDRVQFRAKRNNLSTAAMRRERKKHGKN